MDNRKNTILLTVIAVATLLVAVVGATFAYFTAQQGGTTTKNVNLTTGSQVSETFYINKDIGFSVAANEFKQGGGDKTDSATATATLTASNDTDAYLCYTLVLTSTVNDFAYTALNTTETPELTLHVTKETGTVADSDATTAQADMIALPADKSSVGDLTADGPETYYVPTAEGGASYVHKLHAAAGETARDTFNVTVTFKNLDVDQSNPGPEGSGAVNTGKTFTGTLTFNKVAGTCDADNTPSNP